MLAAALRRASAPGRCAARGRSYAAPPAAIVPAFNFTELFAPAAPKDTAYRKLSGDGVSTLDAGGKRILQARGCEAAPARRTCLLTLTRAGVARRAAPAGGRGDDGHCAPAAARPPAAAGQHTEGPRGARGVRRAAKVRTRG
jgi:hypothetical protein